MSIQVNTFWRKNRGIARSQAHEVYVCEKEDDKAQETEILKKRNAAVFYRTIVLKGRRCNHSAAV